MSEVPVPEVTSTVEGPLAERFTFFNSQLPAAAGSFTRQGRLAVNEVAVVKCSVDPFCAVSSANCTLAPKADFNWLSERSKGRQSVFHVVLRLRVRSTLAPVEA